MNEHDMAVTNDDLRIRLERVDGKLDALGQIVADLKLAIVGISELSKDVGRLSGNTRVMEEIQTRQRDDIHDLKNWQHEHMMWTEKSKKEITDAIDTNRNNINALDNWKNWIMGGLAVIAFIGGYAMFQAEKLSNRVETAMSKALDNANMNDTQEVRLRALERNQIVQQVNTDPATRK